jgi:hypothetical protein
MAKVEYDEKSTGKRHTDDWDPDIGIFHHEFEPNGYGAHFTVHHGGLWDQSIHRTVAYDGFYAGERADDPGHRVPDQPVYHETAFFCRHVDFYRGYDGLRAFG